MNEFKANKIQLGPNFILAPTSKQSELVTIHIKRKKKSSSITRYQNTMNKLFSINSPMMFGTSRKTRNNSVNSKY